MVSSLRPETQWRTMLRAGVKVDAGGWGGRFGWRYLGNVFHSARYVTSGRALAGRSNYHYRSCLRLDLNTLSRYSLSLTLSTTCVATSVATQCSSSSSLIASKSQKFAFLEIQNKKTYLHNK